MAFPWMMAIMSMAQKKMAEQDAQKQMLQKLQIDRAQQLGGNTIGAESQMQMSNTRDRLQDQLSQAILQGALSSKSDQKSAAELAEEQKREQLFNSDTAMGTDWDNRASNQPLGNEGSPALRRGRRVGYGGGYM